MRTSTAEELDARRRDAYAIADPQSGRRGLLHGGVAAIVVADADIPDHRLVLACQFVADEAAADRADDRRHRSARAAADQAAEPAADQRAADGTDGVGHVLHRPRLDRLDGADAADRLLGHLIRRRRVARAEQQREARGGRRTCAPPEIGVRHLSFLLRQSGIEYSKYIAASRLDGRPSLPSQVAKIGSMS